MADTTTPAPSTAGSTTVTPKATKTETTSAPRTVAGTPTVQGGNSATGGQAGTVAAGELDASDFKKDGTLRKSAVRDIEKDANVRASERSFNEVTGKTTVTTNLGGSTITFEEDGDTRGPSRRERATDSAIRAMDRANEEK